MTVVEELVVSAEPSRDSESRLRQRQQPVRTPFAAADASLAAVEAQLPHFLATDSEDSEDDEDFTSTIPVR